jgi:hypothetical protein
MKKQCKQGNHEYIEIMSKHHWDDSNEIVQWCKYCGCLRTVIEMDGRICNPSYTICVPQILID